MVIPPKTFSCAIVRREIVLVVRQVTREAARDQKAFPQPFHILNFIVIDLFNTGTEVTAVLSTRLLKSRRQRLNEFLYRVVEFEIKRSHS